MIFLTFMIGILNLCLGYALAVNLGYGPLSLPDAWHALSTGPSGRDGSGRAIGSEPSLLGDWKIALAREGSGMAALEQRLRRCVEPLVSILKLAGARKLFPHISTSASGG